MISDRTHKQDHIIYILLLSILLVTAGLIGIGAVKAGLLFFLLPVMVLLLLYSLYKHYASAADPNQSRTSSASGSIVPIFQTHTDRESVTSHPLYTRMLQVLITADRDLRQLRLIADRTEDHRVSQSLQELCRITQSINERIRVSPGSLPSIQRFYDYYLRTARTLWTQYDTLIRSPFYNKDMEYQVKRIENLQKPLHRHFERYLNRLVRIELSGVELEVNTLEQVMRSEG